MAIIRQYHKDTDTTYVYESESYWVPELGQSRSRRKLLGKLTLRPARLCLWKAGAKEKAGRRKRGAGIRQRIQQAPGAV